jgi:hypothetical protein
MSPYTLITVGAMLMTGMLIWDLVRTGGEVDKEVELD